MILRDTLPRQLLRFAPKYFAGLGYSARLFTYGVFSERHRAFVWKLCQHFGWPDGRPVARLPKVPVDTFFEGAGPLEVLALDAADGNVSHLELLAINRLVKRHRPRRLFEIGTFDGRTSLNMVANTPEGHLFTLDLPPGQLSETALAVEKADVPMILKSGSGGRFAGTPYAARITQLYGDSASFDYSEYLGSMDFVFVDGSHAYEYVQNDAAVALRLLSKGGGTIVFHDYDGAWDGVTRALNELAETDPAFKNLQHLTGTSLAYMTVGGQGDAVATPR